MFRRSKHYDLTAPVGCVLIDEHRFLSGALVNMSLHGAFVAMESGHPIHLEEGAILWLSARLDTPRNPELTFALDRGALVWSNTGCRTPDPILETQVRVAWRNYGRHARIDGCLMTQGYLMGLGKRAFIRPLLPLLFTLLYSSPQRWLCAHYRAITSQRSLIIFHGKGPAMILAKSGPNCFVRSSQIVVPSKM
jgi:hypothetical protein